MSLLGFLIQAVDMLLTILQWLIIAAALVTWVSPDPRNPIVQFLFRSTEWILRPCRRILSPRWTGGIDFSPVLAILFIVFVRYLVIGLLSGVPFRIL